MSLVANTTDFTTFIFFVTSLTKNLTQFVYTTYMYTTFLEFSGAQNIIGVIFVEIIFKQI